MQQAAYSTADIQGMTKSFQQANPGVKVNPTFVAYGALHDKIVAAAPAGTYDVVLMDVIWPPEFGSKHEVVDVTDRYPSSWRGKIFPGALETATYKGRYYGVPWILDTKYFFYNKDMLKRAGQQPPTTWDEVVAVAKALEYMRQTLDDGITNPASTESVEEDVRKVISQGQAAMALNWTYMFALANDPKESQVPGQIAVAHTPSGPAGAPGCNGSMALCIASGSKNPDAAWKYIEFLTSQKVQNQYAKLSLPIWKSSYDDPQVVKTLPEVVAVAKTQLNDMILRPQIPSYNSASQVLQVSIQKALTG